MSDALRAVRAAIRADLHACPSPTSTYHDHSHLSIYQIWFISIRCILNTVGYPILAFKIIIIIAQVRISYCTFCSLTRTLKGLRKRLLAELVYEVSEKCLIRNPPYLRSLRLSLPECLSLLSLVYNWALTSRGLLKTDTVLHFL